MSDTLLTYDEQLAVMAGELGYQAAVERAVARAGAQYRALPEYRRYGDEGQALCEIARRMTRPAVGRHVPRP